MKVTLISYTKDPIGTLLCLWENSRSNEPTITLESLQKSGDARNTLAMDIIDSQIPVAEAIQFVFLLEDIPISLREQLVRHRIGVKVDSRIGCDIVPDLADSSWWSQSMRILDMGTFANEGRFFNPESLDTEQKKREYAIAMDIAEQQYRELVRLGVPLEDARNVIPLGATHRISWSLNLVALKHIIGKRSCWILQLGLWEPIIRGMVDELATKVDPLFRRLIDPPCFKKGKWEGCKFELDNERRAEGKDPLPPCSLWHNRDMVSTPDLSPLGLDIYRDMQKKYRDLWQRDPVTGEPL